MTTAVISGIAAPRPLLQGLLLACLLAAAALASAVTQDDEDLTFDDDGVVRSRREIDVAPVAAPLQDTPSFLPGFLVFSDDEDAEGSAIEGSGLEPHPPTHPTCPPGRWQCPSGRCVRRCDGFNECLDASDELGCDTFTTQAPERQTPTPPPGCRGDDQFTCVDNSIICDVQRCDGKEDCPQGDDEEGCDCDEGHFSCDDLRCVPNDRKCDGVQDCIDNTDEKDCKPSKPECRSDDQGPNPCPDSNVQACFCDGVLECPGGEDEDPVKCDTIACSENEVACDGGTRCVNLAQICDGEFHCSDLSDETDCPTSVLCQSDEFRCNDGECISHFRRCDFITDCVGGEDEESCPCEPPNFECISGMCINPEKRCDGVKDCDDGSDETVNCRCSEGFLCHSGECLDQNIRCNGEPDCPDLSDEKNCSGCSEGAFLCGDFQCISEVMVCDGIQNCDTDELDCCDGSGMFQCDDGDTCLSGEKICDGIRDCADGLDEYQCSGQCPVGKYTCDDGTCIDISYRCNGFIECPDQSDETGCPCGSSEWTCSDGSCIPLQAFCDGRIDCPDFSDEENCPAGCGAGEWTCVDGSCVPESARCDGVPQCLDRSDEENCPQECHSDEWTCDDGVCIPQQARCDGRYDCLDSSDEASCPPRRCGTGEWTCLDGSCIPEEGRCDTLPQCIDRSDEENCPEGCGTGEWTCLDGSCVPREARCDGVPQCIDRSDEENCPEGCGTGEWTCLDGSCVPREARCDGVPQCIDRSDEENCPEACGPEEWTCGDGSCIPQGRRCDERYDCPDYSDEDGCLPVCGSGEWTCRDGTCIAEQYRCDGSVQCPYASDEEGCPERCGFGEWTCSDGSCIPEEARCDGVPHCLDRTDEENCFKGCSSEEWTCGDGFCIPQQRRCDGRYDCPDYTDEDQCTEACGSGQWSCRDGSCVPQYVVCDGRYDCPDYSDEEICRPACGPDEWTCLDGTCLPLEARCDGYPQCYDRSDEENCPPSCDRLQWTCRDGTCIPQERRCDGRYDCPDYTDEFQCPVECGPGSWTCRDGTCVAQQARCDDRYDCPDYSDEEGCPECRPGEWQCKNKYCIPVSQRCDRVPQCPDFSDEQDCTACNSLMEWQCDLGLCIDLSLRCNGKQDCLTDNSDEQNCSTLRPTCGSDKFTCRDGTCISASARCNNQNDCRDYYDELDCSPSMCRPPESFLCNNGYCIRADQRCDGTTDCQDTSDEKDCPPLCTNNDFRCDDGTCLPLEDRCNGLPECIDQSDEANCTRVCRPDQFRCEDGQCLDLSQRCNGYEECFRGEDERGCRPFEFQCGSGHFIDQQYRCNGIVECPLDLSDEEGCTCKPDEFRCLHDGLCISSARRCDGQSDCSDASDEQNCPCSQDEWRCLSGQCIPINYRCDGRPDCIDSSDEFVDCIQPSPPPVTPSRCSSNQFECKNGECVLRAYRCDGIPDCIDGSDENEAECTTPTPGCSTNQFACSNGECVDLGKRCDRNFDCLDSSDETGCPPSPANGECTENEFKCLDGACIDKDWRCDSVPDCSDASDENNCCKPLEFQCGDGYCIPEYNRCDGTYDCTDGSDERDNCECQRDEFQCKNGDCISSAQRCNGYPDCRDRSDEQNCSCGSIEWQCETGECIFRTEICNGVRDCLDGSDERGCPDSSKPCNDGQFRCSTGECIDHSRLYDGYDDCEDGQDEKFFSVDDSSPSTSALVFAPEIPARCTENEFLCQSGECVSSRVMCDGRSDCFDGSDEHDCDDFPIIAQNCSAYEFRCKDRSCVTKNARCNGIADCTDGSDEHDCPLTECQPYEFQCLDGQCISSYARCDGTADCPDGSDESGCTTTTTIRTPVINSFQCLDGRYIDDSLRCDGRRDCSDGSDEVGCATDRLNLETYPDDQTIQQSQEVVFQCRDEGSLRAPVRWIREGNRPMPPGTTDVRGRLTMPNIQVEHSGTYYCEAQNVSPTAPGRRQPVYLRVTPYVVPTQLPQPVCGTKEATCMNGQCIDKDKVCDGVFDCSDASDEMRCSPLGCEPNEFQCDNKKCMLKTWVCDSDDDCGDNSDEQGCTTNPPGSPCRYNEFTCHNGDQCIPKSFHCDGEVDCQDSTDEQGCSKPTVVEPPPRNKMVQVSETFSLTCLVIGVPTPTVIWRLNWGHVPAKCEMTSVEGRGTLVCPSAQPTDQGAYSCEAINTRGSVFALPDTIVQVKGGSPLCEPPQFNAGAVTPEECLTCFCFGATDQCFSSDRYITQLPPPSSNSYSLVGVNQDQFQGNYVIRADQYPLSSRYLQALPSNAVQLPVDRTRLGGPSDLLVYFSLPESHKGQQLPTYGGYLRYKIRYSSSYAGQSISGPDVIIRGNNKTLMHVHDGSFLPDYENQVDIRFHVGQWFRRVVGRGRSVQTQEPASREDIMMVLENMELLLIRALYHDGLYVNATLSDVQLDTAVLSGSEQGRAVLVEECRCPQGYMGLSCQECAPNYRRVQYGLWLGRCVLDIECGPQEYGDPANGIPCLPCPCPLSTPNNQFSTSCYLDNDGRVTCNCQQGYQGRRCELCASGYEGNPSISGDSCKPVPPSCEWYEFICRDMSSCFHKDKRCDLIPDCPDGSDEEFCEPVTCMTTFTCLDGSVHPWSRRCDGIKDCTDFEDERECNVCFNSGHKCSDQHCVHFERICDGHADCNDRSDELPQNCLDQLPCDHIHQWTCGDPRRTCIERSRHCDGFYDCPDQSDELYCNCTCDEAFHFRCYDGTCLEASVHCNSRIDCPDGSDELWCSCDANTQHTCGDGTCIDLRRVCDGRYDCRDASDEPVECNSNCDPNIMHQCGDGSCIDIRQVCDGRVDCRDYSDEPPSCTQGCDPQYEFTCRNRDCIDIRLMCNGYSDCRDGSDEYYCQACKQYEFQCGDGSCISRQQLCDGRPDCSDLSDESEQAGCCVPPYFFQCFDGTCIDARQVCNRYYDCDDGSDEYDCSGECDPVGSYSAQADPETGLCQCKEYVTGPKCDQCKPNSFYLNENNRYGCIDCFCMGITKQCTSSNWYRQQESVSFTNDRQGFELVDKFQQTVISNDIFVDSGRQELVFREFSRIGQEVYYWKLPQRFLRNKVSSYGGNLTYSLRYVPSPGGQSSTNSASAVEIYGNDITLKHYSRSPPSATRQETVSVPLYEQFWERQDGQEANREHFLMALADLEYILIKATYTTNTREVGLKEVILDYAEPRNTGQVRAFAVEMCECPQRYQGLSCEDCAVGYTRSLSGVHLGTCIPCNCNGHSEECDPETGVCSNCRDNTAGDFCDRCAPGYEGYATGRCYYQGGSGSECDCDQRGTISCEDGRCQCKANVHREACDACQPGYFHLTSENPDGCLQCWCSGVSSQCYSSNYYRTQLPMQLLTDHGFTFSNRLQTNVIQDRFDINVAQNEISFADFTNLRESETYYWSLPQMFTGNRLPSYGGNITITQRYEARPGGNTYADPDIIIRSSGGREFIWMSPRPLQPNVEQTYSVRLTEDSFTMNQQPASRFEFLNALSSVSAILVRATLSDRMSATFLRDVIMDTAVASQTGQPRALEVEQCQCPRKYSGLSCQQCKPGYYRDSTTNQCNLCPCDGREESCAQLPDGSVKCDCLPGYYGPYCRGSGLMLELRPIKVLFNQYSREVFVNFTCSYHSSEPLRITFTREPTLLQEGAPVALMDTQAWEYSNGGKYYSVMRLLNGHRTVTCRVYDAGNMEVAQMVSQIMYSNPNRMTQGGGRPTVSVTVLEPRIQTVALGSTVQFQCSARSQTGPQNRVSVTWSKASSELPYGRASDNREGLLVISQVQASDSGTYICAATDGFGRMVTENATLIVGGARPRVTVEERREVVELRVGDTLEVRCSAEGSPRPQVTWTYGPNRELPVNVFQQNGVLSFRNAQPSDSGEYYCTATNAQGTDYARIIINVVAAGVPPPVSGGPLIIVQVSQDIVEARSGETVRVRCFGGTQGQLRIKWSRLSGPLPSQALTENGELQIPNARPADSGIYVCRITDERTNNFEESSARITITQTVNLPAVQIQPDRQTINQGTNAELRCVVSGDPPPVITWSKVNEEFSASVSTVGNILRITDAVINDRGMYICTAENEGGAAQAAAIVEVERREPPFIEVYPEVKQTIVVGASALFQCHLTAGIPTPNVQWVRTDGRPLTPNTEILNGGVLRFNQVQGDEEGSYTCTAENDAGVVEATAILEIQSLPVITIRPGRSPHLVRIGERVRLECSAQGDPAPSVNWQRLQINIQSNIPSVSVSPTVAVYEIASVTKADEGTYQCTARNTAGLSEERIQLSVEDILPGNVGPGIQTPPPHRQPDSGTNYVPVGGSFEFECSGRGPDADDIQITFRRTDERPLPFGTRVDGGILYFTNVDESASGEYACMGSDRISGSILFTFYKSFQVLAPPRITLQPARQVVRPGERVHIHCSATGAQPITISWSKETGYMPPSVIINGGEMMFRGIETSDAGWYICTAVNNAGTAEAVAEVVVNATEFEDKLEVYPVNPPKTPNSGLGGVGITEDLFFDNVDDDDIDPSSTPDEGYFLSLRDEVVCKFVCQDDTICLTSSQMCDGNPDCPNGSDEQDCQIDDLVATCPESPCGNKYCIPPHKICDGIPDCNDAADEDNCHENIFDLDKCTEFFKCGDGSCYSFYLNCDGQCDCNDCKDEKICFRHRRHIVYEEPLLAAIQQDVVMYVGQTAELRCEASGINPNDVSWSRVGGRLPPGALARGNLLRLPFVQPEDSGRYECTASTPSGYRTSDIITLTIERLQTVDVQIRPSRSNVRIGDDVQFTCEVGGEPAAAVSWSRLNTGLPLNAQPQGNILRLNNVQADNGGVYQCTVTTASGVSEGSYALVIQGIISTENINFGQNTRSVKTRSVVFGSGVVMDCRVSLPPPVSYTWTKQGGKLPANAVVQDAILDIPEVHIQDAGLYVCTGSNQERSIDLPTLLVVSGVVPRFRESSYLSLATLPRAFVTFVVEISFKPESQEGLILYNSQHDKHDDGDFVSFGLSGGYAEFRFDVGSGPAIVRSRDPLEMNQWYTVKLSRNRKEGTMIIDDGPAVRGRSEGRFIGLDLVKPLYLGGVPDFSKVHERAGFSSGFEGCISRLVISNTLTVDLMRDAKNKVGITPCETCSGNPCHNSGVCQEAYAKVGYKCICPAGFSGDHCESTGESCYPGVCGTGRCVNKPQGFECYCPFGKIGERCEQDITIYEPAFGDGAYMAYETPRALKRFAVDLNFKPQTLDDGILMYCAQQDRGEGDFASLAIRNKRLEFRFDAGSGTATILSDPLEQNQWFEVRANRTDRLGSLRLNDGPMQNAESPGPNHGLNLLTPLYIGGVDHSRIEISPKVEVKSGFRGCVSQIKIMDHEVRLAESLLDSANVRQCGGSSASLCSQNPCRNNGQCVDAPSSSRGYVCTCQEGYSGHDCENEPGVCSIVQPCKNGGTCIGSNEEYSCYCPLGFAGHHCEHVIQALESALFTSNSWIEFDQSLLPEEGDAPQSVTFEFTTRKPEGLLFWYGQESNVSGHGQDYISIAIKGGFVEFSYELGTGPATVRSSSRVDDGRRHILMVNRTGQEGSLKLDRSPIVYGKSRGIRHMLNAKGNIYIGGVPDLPMMTAGSHTIGFSGCIHRLSIGEEKDISFMEMALSGVNVTPCQRGRRGRGKGRHRG